MTWGAKGNKTFSCCRAAYPICCSFGTYKEDNILIISRYSANLCTISVSEVKPI